MASSAKPPRRPQTRAERLIGRTLWTGIALAFLYGAIMTWTGPRRWAAFKARLEKEGETLDFKKLLPATPPEALNLCAIEQFRDITMPGDDQSPQGRKRNSLKFLGGYMTKSPETIRGHFVWGSRANFAPWISAASEPGGPALSSDIVAAAKNLLQRLDQDQPFIKELAEAAPMHPAAAFLPPLTKSGLSEKVFRIRSPHLKAVEGISQALFFRASLANLYGENAAAVQSTLAILRLTEAFQQVPLIFDYIASARDFFLAEDALWQMLEKRSPTEGDLITLQTSLQEIDFVKAQLQAMRGELIRDLELASFMQANFDRLKEINFPYGELPASSRPRDKLAGMIPDGLFDHAHSTLADMYYENIIQPLKAGDLMSLRIRFAEMSAGLRTRHLFLYPSRYFSRFMLPPMDRVIRNGCWMEALRRQAMLACALERYYLQHQTYPTTLPELVPSFIDSVPDDPIDNQPMRYRQTPTGRYLLWSKGLDAKDDAGRATRQHDSQSRLINPHSPLYKGDWVWQYEASAEGAADR